MPRERHRRDRQHQHDPEQPAELRDVIMAAAMARMAVGCVVRVALMLRVIDLDHAFHYTPWGYPSR